MRRLAALLAFLAACGATSSTGSGASAVVTGDSCALHQDDPSCRADPQGCVWYSNTRPCQLGQPCPAGWCSKAQPSGGGSTGGSGGASAACACPGASGDVCVLQIGGPAIQVAPPIACEAVPGRCSVADRCACLTGSMTGTCRASDQVANLCVCDDGVR
jgi:hypothetical protein